jgi:hypothetical protein
LFPRCHDDLGESHFEYTVYGRYCIIHMYVICVVQTIVQYQERRIRVQYGTVYHIVYRYLFASGLRFTQTNVQYFTVPNRTVRTVWDSMPTVDKKIWGGHFSVGFPRLRLTEEQ